MIIQQAPLIFFYLDIHQTSFPQYVSDVTSDEETVYDRTVWASERLSLQMALDSAEHEIQRLRGELQQFRKFMNAEGQLVTVDHEKVCRRVMLGFLCLDLRFFVNF